jgi:hypothetical protein
MSGHAYVSMSVGLYTMRLSHTGDRVSRFGAGELYQELNGSGCAAHRMHAAKAWTFGWEQVLSASSGRAHVTLLYALQ